MKYPQDYQEFKDLLEEDAPSPEWSLQLRALWWDAKGNWHEAHNLVDGSNVEYAEWIHAYLHRKEGDEWNAGYWYRMAGKDFPKISLEEELRELVIFFLSN